MRKNEGDNGEYGVNIGVKTHMEWLPVSRSVKKFFVHLLDVLDKYFSHAYEIKISHSVNNREEQELLYDPTINISLPEEYKNALLKKCDFFQH